jgi:hypothetical protein
MRRPLVRDPVAWAGAQLQRDTSWTHCFGRESIEEIDAALAHAKSTGARIPFAKEFFPLPRVAGKLADIRDEIEKGRGLALIRGLPRARYTAQDCELLHCGLGIRCVYLPSFYARGFTLLDKVCCSPL